MDEHIKCWDGDPSTGLGNSSKAHTHFTTSPTHSFLEPAQVVTRSIRHYQVYLYPECWKPMTTPKEGVMGISNSHHTVLQRPRLKQRQPSRSAPPVCKICHQHPRQQCQGWTDLGVATWCETLPVGKSPIGNLCGDTGQMSCTGLMTCYHELTYKSKQHKQDISQPTLLFQRHAKPAKMRSKSLQSLRNLLKVYVNGESSTLQKQADKLFHPNLYQNSHYCLVHCFLFLTPAFT